MNSFNAPAGQSVDLTEIMVVGQEYEVEHTVLGNQRVRVLKKVPNSIHVENTNGMVIKMSCGLITSVTRIKGA